MEKIIISEREFDVLELIAQGDSNKEICDKLGITYNTLKTHLNNIYLKAFNENVKMYGQSVMRVRLVLKFQNNEFEKKIYYGKNRKVNNGRRSN